MKELLEVDSPPTVDCTDAVSCRLYVLFMHFHVRPNDNLCPKSTLVELPGLFSSDIKENLSLMWLTLFI